MKVLISVTHLLGTGHLSRALTLARAFSAQGHRAVLLSGGFPAPQLNTEDVELVQLPPLRSDGVNFTRLLTETGKIADASYLAQRRIDSLANLEKLRPDTVITELYPFGRRSLATEFQSLLEAAQAMPSRPVILSSVRDILAPPSKPSKVETADAMIDRFYDAVLVHADPSVTPLEVSWPVSTKLHARLRYTGFVAPPAPRAHPQGEGRGEVLVSAGGGSVGSAVFKAAAQASLMRPDLTWRLLVGGADAENQIAQLRALETPAIIEAARSDFRQMLGHAAVSISMCGYNTAMDLLQTGVPSILIPFDAGGEVEQTLRANSLTDLPQIEVLRSVALTAQNLCAALDRVLSDRSGPRLSDTLRFDGAERTVKIVEDMVDGRK